MKFSIIIPNWNGAEKLKRNLPEILKVARKNRIEEIIISDDASTDNSVEVIKNNFPEIVLIERKENGGFSSNVNTGVSNSSGDLIILLNNDALLEDDFLKFVLPHFNNKKTFSVGCNVGNGLWSTGEFKDGFFWHGQGKAKEDEIGKPHQSLWSSGGSGIFRKNIWDELHGLDTLFDPFYEEDVDLGYRATKRGYINIWEPRSRVKHYHEAGVIATHFNKKAVTRVAERNHLLFIWKNITSKKLINEHKKKMAEMLILHPGYCPIFLAALEKLPQVLQKRKIEEKEAKLSDEEVFSIFSSA